MVLAAHVVWREPASGDPNVAGHLEGERIEATATADRTCTGRVRYRRKASRGHRPCRCPAFRWSGSGVAVGHDCPVCLSATEVSAPDLHPRTPVGPRLRSGLTGRSQRGGEVPGMVAGQAGGRRADCIERRQAGRLPLLTRCAAAPYRPGSGGPSPTAWRGSTLEAGQASGAPLRGGGVRLHRPRGFLTPARANGSRGGLDDGWMETDRITRPVSGDLVWMSHRRVTLTIGHWIGAKGRGPVTEQILHLHRSCHLSTTKAHLRATVNTAQT